MCSRRVQGNRPDPANKGLLPQKETTALMPFIAVAGTFHLVNRTVAGTPSGFEPDGDSIHFRPTDAALLQRLRVVGRPLAPTNIGSVMLRFESIDALELHYQADNGVTSHQPRPLADQSRDFLTGALGMNPVPYVLPRGVRVKPPVPHDATPGYIIARTLEVNGRPVSFAFAGPCPFADGAEVFLTPALLKTSLNYKLLRGGHAYPLFYDTLFVDLRKTMQAATRRARAAGKGIWALDRTNAGIALPNGQADLEQSGVIFPKLFRRLSDFLARGPAGTVSLAGFPAWLAASEERVLDLPTINFTGFDNLVEVGADLSVRMTRKPEEVVFIGAK